MTMAQVDGGLLWAGAAGGGAVSRGVAGLIAPRRAAAAAAVVGYAALCLLAGPPELALACLGGALACRRWGRHHG